MDQNNFVRYFPHFEYDVMVTLEPIQHKSTLDISCRSETSTEDVCMIVDTIGYTSVYSFMNQGNVLWQYGEWSRKAEVDT